MLSDVMDHYGLAREFSRVGYFETEHHKEMFKELKASIKLGKLVALSGIVGCGKTITLERIQDVMEKENEILVSSSLAVEKGRVKVGTLMLALFYDLATEKDFKIPTQTEKRERKLRDLIRKRNKPIVLFIDEAHDLNSKTLVDLKRLIELIQKGGGVLSIVLAGHPKLKNDLRRSAMEEIGSRTTVIELDGIKGHQQEYIEWLLSQCKNPKAKIRDIFTEEAIEMLAQRLATPLQIERYLDLAVKEGYRLGQKPITPDIIESVFAPDLDELEPRLTRHGYNVKALADLLNVRPIEIRAFLHGQLTPGRNQELQNQMLANGIPL